VAGMTYSQEPDSALKKKSYTFAIRVVNMSQYLIAESRRAESTADFIHKLNIALKEADETHYWISLLKDTKFIDEKMYTSMSRDVKELIAMLVSSIKTSKLKLKIQNTKRKVKNEEIEEKDSE
jgi:hypothetical protein